MVDARRFSPSSARNREPILAALKRFVAPGRARILEIASGSGEHAIFLADGLRAATWQPTDADPAARASVDAWREHAPPEIAARVLPALELDVTTRPWPVGKTDVVVCINMIHIAPLRACESLVAGASEVLTSNGILYLYGPYRRGGAHTAPSNEAFDARLRGENPAWGVRDLETVVAEGAKHGLVLEDVAAMPANNLSVVFRRP